MVPFERIVLDAVGAERVTRSERIQSLWSGYGEILRVHLQGSRIPSVIVKHVSPPADALHPRGWATDLSRERKLKSYRVEHCWYERYAQRCAPDGAAACRIPERYHCHSQEHEWLFVLEDLDAAGFPLRKGHLTQDYVLACLRFLAAFHATFMGQEPHGLWQVGTYWHLETRPEELNAMQDAELKGAATELDRCLRCARYQTLVHGDAKVANFCFSPSGDARVAAVDFQYVGGGVGVKDVAYFLSSIWDEAQCERQAGAALDYYFTQLEQALAHLGVSIEFQALEQEWRELYPVAWADFYRFLDGWAPGHYKMHGYSRRMTRLALERLRP